MIDKMKQFIYILLAFILLVACQKNEAFDSSEGKGTLVLRFGRTVN